MRSRYHLISWHPTSDESKTNELQNKVVSRLTDEQKRANTTRGSTPGLIRPWLGEAGGRVPHPNFSNGQCTCRGSRPQQPKVKKAKTAKATITAIAGNGSVGASVTETTSAGKPITNHNDCLRLVSKPLIVACPD